MIKSFGFSWLSVSIDSLSVAAWLTEDADSTIAANFKSSGIFILGRLGCDRSGFQLLLSRGKGVFSNRIRESLSILETFSACGLFRRASCIFFSS